MRERCKRNCVYVHKAFRGEWNSCWGCDYMAIVRESRVAHVYAMLGVKEMTDEARELLKPLNCPVYEWNGEEEKEERPRKRTENLVKLDPVELRRLWAMGMTDREIAREMHVTRRAVGQWRKQIGLGVDKERREKRKLELAKREEKQDGIAHE